MDSNFFKCWYYTTNAFQSILLLIVRVYWGFLFFIGGFYKITDMAPFIDFMNQLGVSTTVAYLVTLVELIGGILIFFGFLSRIGAACTAVIMFAAYIVAHPAQFYSFFRDPAYFFSAPPFSFLFASLVVLFFGPGMLSIDAIFKRKLMEDAEKPRKKK
ncbi:MAG: hypothetical protein S4CHLAM7_05630 [Chlamydiae bacterium]|nr:hypothetical protein [Chlamydiota bacterium]